MKKQVGSILGMAAVVFFAADAPARPEYYTDGFYTRGSDAALYVDQGGIPDPFYIPARKVSVLPRVTLEAVRDDNFFMVNEDERAVTTVNLIPGVLTVYGRPEHNHLYADAGLILPVYESDAALDRDPSYMITAGGIYKTGRGQVHGRVGHRRQESTNTVLGRRIVAEDYIADLALERRISSKSGLGLNGALEFHEFNEADYVDYRRYYGAGRFYHRLTQTSEWFLQAGIGRDELERDLKGVYSDATFYDVSLGLRGRPAPKTSVSGRVGYRWQDYDDGSISSISGWIASMGVQTSPFGFSTFSAEVLSDIRPDITATGDSTVDNRLILGVHRRLFMEQLRGDASLLLGTVDYHGPAGKTTDDYWGYRLGLDWWTRWNLSFGLGYHYTQRLSDERASYESGLWTLRMSWNY